MIVKPNPSRMISIKTYTKIFFASFALITVASCTDPWDDHGKTSDQNLDQNLSERIQSTSQTTEFGKLLEETGFDGVLSNSKTYTVWAPTNDAIGQVDPSLLSDLAKKRLFVQNHIALTAFSSVTEQDTVTVQMLSNKYLEFRNGTMIEDATVVSADQYASNGLFHIIGKALEPRLNIWQYVKSKAGSNTMSSYLSSLNSFDIYRSDSIAKANEPEIHKLYADSLRNSYLTNVYNLNNEKNKYTLFLLENNGFNSEVDNLEPYLIKGTADSTRTYASYFTVRDMAFHKAVARENLSTTQFVSRFGVEVPIDEDNIVEEVLLSNGIVYIMSALEVPLENRLLTTQIEGEKPNGFSQNDKRSNTFYREKEDPDGILFYDIMVQNHGVPQFAINYSANNMYSTTYQAYWRAINDIQGNTFMQTLRVGGTVDVDGMVIDPIAELEYEVGLNVYDEVLIGEFTLDEAGRLDLISLVAANTGVNGNNTLTLDYLKLVPVIK
ncbi:fasciclin domain-containing protein [Flavobacteriaceae bacterium SZ-1-7]|uniref:fasciclin domain-containing protein n=1 Tax=Tamlana sedimenti TaxID=3134126 RepID=UPI003128EE75